MLSLSADQHSRNPTCACHSAHSQASMIDTMPPRQQSYSIFDPLFYSSREPRHFNARQVRPHNASTPSPHAIYPSIPSRLAATRCDLPACHVPMIFYPLSTVAEWSTCRLSRRLYREARECLDLDDWCDVTVLQHSGCGCGVHHLAADLYEGAYHLRHKRGLVQFGTLFWRRRGS